MKFKVVGSKLQANNSIFTLFFDFCCFYATLKKTQNINYLLK